MQLCSVVVLISLALSAVSTANKGPMGPCREWDCQSRGWVCTSIEDYVRYQHKPQLHCPTLNLDPPTSPSGQCRLVNGSCQYTWPTVVCYAWIPIGDYRYTCGNGTGRNRNNISGVASTPTPDMFCEPVNNTCQWYKPCRYWMNHCLPGYQCGTMEEYYQFLFGPCGVPPEGGWTGSAPPPGDCVLVEGQQCGWSDCVAFLDWCHGSWMCGTQYDRSVYYSSPPPSCPQPPPNPPQPGPCQFNVTARKCQFKKNDTATPKTTPTNMVKHEKDDMLVKADLKYTALKQHIGSIRTDTIYSSLKKEDLSNIKKKDGTPRKKKTNYNSKM